MQQTDLILSFGPLSTEGGLYLVFGLLFDEVEQVVINLKGFGGVFSVINFFAVDRTLYVEQKSYWEW